MAADLGLGRQAARFGNAWRRWRGGLPLRGPQVGPAVRNNLYVAHLAVYECATRFATGRRALDLGCGTGYGSAHLLQAGAEAVTGIDPDATAIAFARRRYPNSRLRFLTGRAEDLAALDLGAFDLVVAANVLAHLAAPAAAIAAAAAALAAGGVLLASVPPIVDDRTMDAHRSAGLHRANRYLWDWESLLRDRFAELRLFAVRPPAGVDLDLGDPRRSAFSADSFRCVEIAPAKLEEAGHLAVVFAASAPRGQAPPPGSAP